MEYQMNDYKKSTLSLCLYASEGRITSEEEEQERSEGGIKSPKNRDKMKEV